MAISSTTQEGVSEVAIERQRIRKSTRAEGEGREVGSQNIWIVY